MGVGERAALTDQSVVSLGHPDSMCVTDIQHVKSAIYFPVMFHLRQVANLFFFNAKLKAFSRKLSGSCVFSYFRS